MRNNRLLIVCVGLVIAVVALVAIYSHFKHTNTPMKMDMNMTPPANVNQPKDGVLPTPKTTSPFSMTDDNGQPFSNDNLKGHWTFLFFGFSRCGDVCPTTLSQLNEMSTQLKKDLPAQLIPQVVMITVDPETDSTAVMHKYVRNFNSDFIGAIPNKDTLDTFSKDLGMFYQKVPEGSNGYMMNHSAELYLFNPDGNWVATYSYPREVSDLDKNYETLVKPKA